MSAGPYTRASTGRALCRGRHGQAQHNCNQDQGLSHQVTLPSVHEVHIGIPHCKGAVMLGVLIRNGICPMPHRVYSHESVYGWTDKGETNPLEQRVRPKLATS